jgi:spoIIIJ-associated protein
VEATGENVDKAIEAALNKLGAGRDEVLIEILDEGSSGFLGIGAREAKVSLQLKPEPAAPVDQETDILAEVPLPGKSDAIGVDEPEVEEAGVEEPLESDELAGEELRDEEIGLEIVKNLLDKMEVEAEVSLDQTEPDDLTGERRWVIDVHGDDLGVVIGQRGETLNALEFIARLMTGHVVRRRPTFIVDVEGYRARREQALAKLAERMARKALQRGRPVSLEPMPPNERRIIHITLRENADVYTESFGEGKHRKVRIFPKN